ncbi:MAG: hypothetical protein ABSC55_24375 [Syntrophorhabdales bacterium]
MIGALETKRGLSAVAAQRAVLLAILTFARCSVNAAHVVELLQRCHGQTGEIVPFLDDVTIVNEEEAWS